jgi:hypothetical protein
MNFKGHLHLLTQRMPRGHRTLVIAASMVVLVIAATATAAIGGPNVVRYFATKPGQVSTHALKTSSSQLVSSKTNSATPPPVPSSSASPRASDAPYAVIAGHSYGTPTGVQTDPSSSSIYSSKPLVLSTTNVTMSLNQNSPYITASSPDGYSLCSIASLHEPIGLQAGWPDGIKCGTEITFFLSPPAATGTYTVEVLASTTDHVEDGKYIDYEGYITVVATPSTGYTLSLAPPQYGTFPYGGVDQVSIAVTIVKGGAYSGSPTVTPELPYSGLCSSQTFVQSAPESYLWTCIPGSQTTKWDMTFAATDGATQQDGSELISY